MVFLVVSSRNEFLFYKKQRSHFPQLYRRDTITEYKEHSNRHLFKTYSKKTGIMSDSETKPLFIHVSDSETNKRESFNGTDNSNQTITYNHNNSRMKQSIGDELEAFINQNTSNRVTSPASLSTSSLGGNKSTAEPNTKTTDSTNSILLPLPKSNSIPLSLNSNSLSTSNSNQISIGPSPSKSASRSVSSSQLRKASAASESTNNPNTSFSNFKMSAFSGNRTSVFSDYSGIVHHVDIDTIKYVGNKESLQLSNLSNMSSNEDILDMNSNSYSRKGSVSSVKSSSTPKKINTVPSLSNMVKVIKHQSGQSPIKLSSNSSPPKSPLPQLRSVNFNPANQGSVSPLRKKISGSSTRSSSISSQLHGKLDDVMKEVKDLRFDEDKAKNQLFHAANTSITSASNSLYTGTNSFHTAKSDPLVDSPKLGPHYYDDHINSKYVDEYGKQTHDDDIEKPELMTLDPLINNAGESPVIVQGSSKTADYDSIPRSESIRTYKKSSSNYSNSKSSSYPSKSSDSHKSKRKHHKNKLKPFSYETLAKLLNATEGIIIGQEFATLNIPTEEKFLIERIVDSISRLTANMMLNPARYDQSCARLERVLNVLEGFD